MTAAKVSFLSKKSTQSIRVMGEGGGGHNCPIFKLNLYLSFVCFSRY